MDALNNIAWILATHHLPGGGAPRFAEQLARYWPALPLRAVIALDPHRFG